MEGGIRKGDYGSTALALGRVAVGCSTTVTVGGTGASSTAAIGGASTNAHSVATAGSHCCAGVGGVFGSGASFRRSGVLNAAHRAQLISTKAHGWPVRKSNSESGAPDT